jgi:hypothetical protein
VIIVDILHALLEFIDADEIPLVENEMPLPPPPTLPPLPPLLPLTPLTLALVLWPLLFVFFTVFWLTVGGADEEEETGGVLFEAVL